MPIILKSCTELIKIFSKRQPTSVVVVTSRRVAKILPQTIAEIQNSTKIPIKIVYIPDSEFAKEWNELEKLLQQFIKIGLDKKGMIIALGGGSVGDLVGFASAIYQRSVNYIQIPTTLVSQVDSAHGGKTGVNFSGYKNQIGVINEPVAIVIDPRLISSLSNEQVIDGLGEIIKAGFIKDVSILRLLEKETVGTLLKSKNLGMIIHKSIKVKYFHTEGDMKDQGIRQNLNFGHTIGHALELKYKLSHGKAVMIGMLEELRITEKMGLTDFRERLRLQNLLNKMEIKLPDNLIPDWKAITLDKKVSGDFVTLPVLKKVGQVELIIVRVADLKELFY